jgi:hypothetical protein
MTKLLEQAIAQIRELPEDQQDAVAANLINLMDETLTGDEERELIESRQAYGRGEYRPYKQMRHELGLGDN